jgi:cytochrome c oxidase subunit 4
MAGHSESHVHPVSLYTRTLWWLMALLIATVAAGYIPNVPNWLGVVIALTIAVWKATIVIMNFMHVRFSGKLAWLFAGAGFFWAADYAGVRLRRLCEPPVGAVPRLAGVISVFAVRFSPHPGPP